MSTDTKQKIIDVAIELFALKGFDGVSIREIAKLADVNVAALNYHFKSKENLRQEILDYIMLDFRAKLSAFPETQTCADYALQIWEALTTDPAKTLNQFKLFLESDYHACDAEPHPPGWENFSKYLALELHKEVPNSERMWFVSVVFGYINHMAIISATKIGQRKIEKFMPNKRATLPLYIRQLVESLIRDLNRKYPKS
jgi:AcrR family transcriptional regulator